MRVTLVTALAILTFGLVSRPMHGQMPASDAPALKTIHMVDAQTGWAILIDGGLLRTSDGGTHWKEITPVGSSGQKAKVFRISVLSSQTAWVMLFGPVDSTTAEIFRTFNGGRTWSSAPIPVAAARQQGNATVPALDVTSISFINLREGWLLASLGAYTGNEDVDIYHSTDGGESWILVAAEGSQNERLPSMGHKNAITFLTPTTGWITGYTIAARWLYLYVTHDSGRTWRHQNLSIPPGLTTYWTAAVRAPKFSTAQDGMLAASYELHDDSGYVSRILVVFYVTHDGGKTWSYMTPVSAPVTPYGGHPLVSFFDTKHGWVKEGSRLHVTGDGGRRWMIMPPDPNLADVTMLDFISPQVGWAVRNTARISGGTPMLPFLLKTLDGGRTWTPVNYTILR